MMQLNTTSKPEKRWLDWTPCHSHRSGVTRGTLLRYRMMWPNTGLLPMPQVPAGSPLRGGDFTVCVYDINQSSLPIPFYSVLVSISAFMALSTVIHSINSPDNSVFLLCSLDLIFAWLVLSTICLFMKLSFSPDIIPSGWLGSKTYWLTN